MQFSTFLLTFDNLQNLSEKIPEVIIVWICVKELVSLQMHAVDIENF